MRQFLIDATVELKVWFFMTTIGFLLISSTKFLPEPLAYIVGYTGAACVGVGLFQVSLYRIWRREAEIHGKRYATVFVAIAIALGTIIVLYLKHRDATTGSGGFQHRCIADGEPSPCTPERAARDQRNNTAPGEVRK